MFISNERLYDVTLSYRDGSTEIVKVAYEHVPLVREHYKDIIDEDTVYVCTGFENEDKPITENVTLQAKYETMPLASYNALQMDEFTHALSAIPGQEANLTKIVVSKVFKGTTVWYIADYAFQNCRNLREAYIADGFTELSQGTFEGCENLKTVRIPTTLTGYQYNAFAGCDNLNYSEYDNGLYLGNEDNAHLIFQKAKSVAITSISFHEDTKFIAQAAFKGCNLLSSLSIPEGL